MWSSIASSDALVVGLRDAAALALVVGLRDAAALAFVVGLRDAAALSEPLAAASLRPWAWSIASSARLRDSVTVRRSDSRSDDPSLTPPDPDGSRAATERSLSSPQ
jgi:hypothetical protein